MGEPRESGGARQEAAGSEALGLPELEIAGELEPVVEVGLLAAGGLRVGPAGEAVRAALAGAAADMRSAHGGAALGDIPEVAAVRRLFSALGIDPTKTRPSSEALLRRVLKGQELYLVNNVVDAVNVCSLRWQFPMGLYDLASIRGNIRLGLGGPGAGYRGIGKEHVNLEGRPALHDDLGPFGAPTSDSFRTRVHEGTTAILLVVFAPRGAEPGRLGRCLAGTGDALVRLCSATPGRTVMR